MIPIQFTKVGEFDFYETVTISSDGRYAVEVGNYDAFEQRSGLLTGQFVQHFEKLIGEVDFNDTGDEMDTPFRSQIVVGHERRRISVPHSSISVADARAELADLLQSL